MFNNKLIKKVIDFTNPYYMLPHRKEGYHNWMHISHGLEKFNKIFSANFNDKEKTYFIIAWCFHDVIYDVLSQENEENSVNLFVYFYNINQKEFENLKLEKSILINLIMSTKNHLPASLLNVSDINFELLNNVFLDIDLFYLGEKWDNFLNNRKRVRKDFIVYSDIQYKNGSEIFCDYFLNRKNFRTEYGINNLEKNLIFNLKKYKKMLKENKINI